MTATTTKMKWQHQQVGDSMIAYKTRPASSLSSATRQVQRGGKNVAETNKSL